MTTDQEKVFDRQAALTRMGGDESLFGDLAQFFHEDTPALLEEIRSGLNTGDIEQVSRGAHSLKGLAANFDAHAASEAALHVEQLARDGESDKLENAVEILESEIQRLNDALAPYRQREQA